MHLPVRLQNSHRNGGRVFLIFVADPRTGRSGRTRPREYAHSTSNSRRDRAGAAAQHPLRDTRRATVRNILIRRDNSVPGYQAVSVYLPEKPTTLVILTNTDISYQGSEPSTPLATTITTVLSPDHVYTIGAGVQGPGATPSPAPTSEPR